MAEFRMGGVIGIQKDKLGSPSTGSEDGGGVDLAELVQELDHDEFDGPTVLNGTLNLCESLHAHINDIHILFNDTSYDKIHFALKLG